MKILSTGKPARSGSTFNAWLGQTAPRKSRTRPLNRKMVCGARPSSVDALGASALRSRLLSSVQGLPGPGGTCILVHVDLYLVVQADRPAIIAIILHSAERERRGEVG